MTQTFKTDLLSSGHVFTKI